MPRILPALLLLTGLASAQSREDRDKARDIMSRMRSGGSVTEEEKAFVEKFAKQILTFFLTDPTAKGWFPR